MISVVVCTHNRCNTLDRMLGSYFGQPQLGEMDQELIVIDNNSTDGTRAVVERYAGRPGLRYVFEAEPGLSAARNRGVAEARGSVIAFLDDDVIVSPHWLASLQRCYRETSAKVVGGKARLLLEADAPEWLGPFFRELLSEVDRGDMRREVPDGQGLYGVNLSFDAQALKSVGAFDHRLGRRGGQLTGGEEVTVIARLVEQSARIVYEPEADVRHIVSADRLTWAYFSKLARGYASTKFAREPARGLTWQLLRAARSVIAAGECGLLCVADRAFGRGVGIRRQHDWEAICEWAHLQLRLGRLWQMLRDRRPAAGS